MSKLKRILIFIDWFLPGTLAGGPIRSIANMIDQLESGFEFLIITTNTDYNSNEPYDDITPNKWTKYNEYTNIYYFAKESLDIRNLRKLIKETKHDFVYVNGIYSFYFSILPLTFSSKQKIIASRGMLSFQSFAAKGFKKKIFISIARNLGLYENCIFQVTSLEESENISNLLGRKTKTKLISNLPRKKNKSKRNPQKFNNERNRFIYLARISPEKGQHYILQALQNVSRPLQLDFYGPINDVNYWKKCQQIIMLLPDTIQVRYKGAIHGEDAPSKIAEYDFLVLTSEGENFGHSIVEAMIEGLPVIISNRTPWLHLTEQKVGWDVDVVNSEHVGCAVNAALSLSQQEYTEFSQNSLNYISEHPMIKNALEEYNGLFS